VIAGKAQLPERAARLLAIITFIVALLCFSTATFAQRGALSATRNLSELVDEAGVVVRGRVVSAQAEPHPQFSSLWTVVVTLQVDETLKGQAGGNYTFRQFIWDPRDRTDAAGYRKGGEMLLLLLSPNQNGLSSPAGLEQGRFQITRDVAGRAVASNGRGNAGLLNGVSARAADKGLRLGPRASALVAAPAAAAEPVPLDDLRELIRGLVGGN
jgi:hypothetical protein